MKGKKEEEIKKHTKNRKYKIRWYKSKYVSNHNKS